VYGREREREHMGNNKAKLTNLSAEIWKCAPTLLNKIMRNAEWQSVG